MKNALINYLQSTLSKRRLLETKSLTLETALDYTRFLEIAIHRAKIYEL